ncbi:MAG: hypothetical protein JSR34_00630 [Proteobacteria bacterium]|nr:hypothetical protein [Pseudomonadota bacterium]
MKDDRATTGFVRSASTVRRRLLCACVLSLAISVGAARPMNAVEPDVPSGSLLAGQWTPVSAQMGGQDLPVASFGGASLQLTQNRYDFADDHGSYTVVYAGTPARMDIHGEQGPNAGKTIPALYLLSGEDLTISYQLGPGVRPKDFSSPAGSKILVIHYHRVR